MTVGVSDHGAARGRQMLGIVEGVLAADTLGDGFAKGADDVDLSPLQVHLGCRPSQV